MLAKILIKGEIETVTGMHIGTGGDFSAIGMADSLVIRDAVSGKPIIPGSTLKGKLRTLLARKYNKSFAENPENDDKIIVRLFGSKEIPCKLFFSDISLSDKTDRELRSKEIYSPIEVKSENTINRVTSKAMPRQIERVIRGCVFDFEMIYSVQDMKNKDKTVVISEIVDDFSVLADGFKLLEYDYLGGNGSRGYGKVKFSDLEASVVSGDENGELDDIIESCNAYLRDV